MSTTDSLSNTASTKALRVEVCCNFDSYVPDRTPEHQLESTDRNIIGIVCSITIDKILCTIDVIF